MDKNTEIKFTLNIGFRGEHEETFTLEELGFDPEIDNLDEFLNEEWKTWSSNYIDGGWTINE